MDDIYFMNKAIDMAKKAYDIDEVPIGALIVCDNEIISESYNRKSIDNIATYHAEILAINEACLRLNSWRLDNCTLYTTVEPCMMCTGAIIQSRIGRVVYGTKNDSFGYLRKIRDDRISIMGNVCSDDCHKLLSDFFSKKR